MKPFHWSLPAYRHVGFAAGVHGFSHGVDQVAADAEVAHLHLALSVDQHVGGLHIYGERDGPHSGQRLVRVQPRHGGHWVRRRVTLFLPLSIRHTVAAAGFDTERINTLMTTFCAVS